MMSVKCAGCCLFMAAPLGADPLRSFCGQCDGAPGTILPSPLVPRETLRKVYKAGCKAAAPPRDVRDRHLDGLDAVAREAEHGGAAAVRAQWADEKRLVGAHVRALTERAERAEKALAAASQPAPLPEGAHRQLGRIGYAHAQTEAEHTRAVRAETELAEARGLIDRMAAALAKRGGLRTQVAVLEGERDALQRALDNQIARGRDLDERLRRAHAETQAARDAHRATDAYFTEARVTLDALRRELARVAGAPATPAEAVGQLVVQIAGEGFVGVVRDGVLHLRPRPAPEGRPCGHDDAGTHWVNEIQRCNRCSAPVSSGAP